MHRTLLSVYHLPFFIPHPFCVHVGAFGGGKFWYEWVLGDGNSTLMARLLCSRKKALSQRSLLWSQWAWKDRTALRPMPFLCHVACPHLRCLCSELMTTIPFPDCLAILLPRRTCSGWVYKYSLIPSWFHINLWSLSLLSEKKKFEEFRI